MMRRVCRRVALPRLARSLRFSGAVAAAAPPAQVPSDDILRKAKPSWVRSAKWLTGLALFGGSAYLINDYFGTPEKAARYLVGKLSTAPTNDGKCQIMAALQFATGPSDALKEALILADAVPVLTSLLHDDDIEVRRHAVALLMDITQYNRLSTEVMSTPDLVRTLLHCIEHDAADKEIVMNSLLTLAMLCGSHPDNKLSAYNQGVLTALLKSIRSIDLDIAHVSCTTIGSIVKDFPNVELLKSMPKKDRDRIVAAISQLGQSYIQQGMRHPALSAFLACVDLDPTNPTIHNAIGQLLQMDGKFNEANEHFRSAIKVAPGLLEAHYNLSMNLVKHGSKKDKINAVKLMYDALPYVDKLHPNRPDFLFLLADTLEKIDRVPESCRVYENLIRSYPGNARAYISLGKLYMKLDDVIRARQVLTQAASLRPHDSRAHYLLALCLYRQDQMNEAISHCDTALKLNHDLPNGHLLRGKLYAHRNEWTQALESFANIVRLRPDQPDGYFQMARALEKLDRLPESYEKLTQMIDAWNSLVRKENFSSQAKSSSTAAASTSSDLKRYFDNHPADRTILDLVVSKCANMRQDGHGMGKEARRLCSRTDIIQEAVRA